ncbi:hypothetical protein CROQUDRAFT_653178, partial [Cronartium quercuum f. sp. fusiforme G11]
MGKRKKNPLESGIDSLPTKWTGNNVNQLIDLLTIEKVKNKNIKGFSQPSMNIVAKGL